MKSREGSGSSSIYCDNWINSPFDEMERLLSKTKTKECFTHTHTHWINQLVSQLEIINSKLYSYAFLGWLRGRLTREAATHGRWCLIYKPRSPPLCTAPMVYKGWWRVKHFQCKSSQSIWHDYTDASHVPTVSHRRKHPRKETNEQRPN